MIDIVATAVAFVVVAATMIDIVATTGLSVATTFLSFVLYFGAFFCSLCLLQMAFPHSSSPAGDGGQNRGPPGGHVDGCQHLETPFLAPPSPAPNPAPVPWEPMTTEQYVDTLHAFRRHIDRQQERFPTTPLGRAWKFAEALRLLVGDFERSASTAPPADEHRPHYEAMLRRFYRQNDEAKFAVVDELLNDYKGKEAALFRELAAIYGAPDPLEAFLARPRPSAPTFPSPRPAAPAFPLMSSPSVPVFGTVAPSLPVFGTAAPFARGRASTTFAASAGTTPMPTAPWGASMPASAFPLRPPPSVFGPGFYDTMLRNFCRLHCREKMFEAAEILAAHKGREGELFQSLSVKYAVPNPLTVYLASFTSPWLLPSSPGTQPSSMISSAKSSRPQQNRPSQASLPACQVRTVSTDDMVFLAERLFEAQERFRKEGGGQRPHSIDIGYHYTKQEYLDRIRTDGLMNRQERDSQKIASSYNGSRYGEGIYTADDPQSFSDYGPVGLMVLRLKGVEMDVKESNKGYAKGNNSITSTRQSSLVVLEKRFQCLPVIEFSADLATNQRGLAHLKRLERMVHCLLEEHFNARRPKRSVRQSGHRGRKRNQRSGVCLPAATVPSAPETIVYKAPDRLNDPGPTALHLESFYTAVGLHRFHDEDCSICLNRLNHHCRAENVDKVVRLKICGHEFHEGCAKQALAQSVLCPICRRPQQEVRGRMPSGTMTISYSESQHCDSYEHVGTFVIRYVIPSGTQGIYHEAPGHPYSSADRTAFVPRTLEGMRLVSRLKYAFQRGLTFTVGTSLTSGEKNSVTWSTIHHKTSLTGGTRSHGYPDPTYFYRCNQELNDAGVP